MPRTELCTKETMKKLLNSFQQVVLKPCIGQQGKGIIKITVLDDNTFEIHEKRTKIVKNSFSDLFSYIHEQYLNGNDYIVQQFININKIDGRFFDVRVMSQLHEDEWIITGKLVKVAAREYFISNRASRLLTLEEAFNEIDSHIYIDKCVFLIDKICKDASMILMKNYNGITIIGFDIAIDRYGAIWIIEGNYVPSTSMFYKFAGNKMYETINKYIVLNKKRKLLLSDREEEKN
ncbi:YheC/YheD family protein [Sporosarcina thermotolerans]|uniref:YheC/YheD family protein n=1 Tax=Sporosarcina thermotolerans TaxID=633404 RepID=UPI0024BCFB19|nr:YheC/YheD family protein [Sporosarcina thermotolerans]WHT49932.1 YheC/YheD family protein [Sporosarcina thermotolerans]